MKKTIQDKEKASRIFIVEAVISIYDNDGMLIDEIYERKKDNKRKTAKYIRYIESIKETDIEGHIYKIWERIFSSSPI